MMEVARVRERLVIGERPRPATPEELKLDTMQDLHRLLA